MRKSLFSILAVLLLGTATIFTSCKKDKEASTQEKLVGKWSLDKMYLNYHFMGMTEKDTIAGSGSDYIQLNGDGTASGSGEGQISSGTWSLTDNKLVIKENDSNEPAVGYDIKKITSSELELYNKEVEGESYMEITIRLTK